MEIAAVATISKSSELRQSFGTAVAKLAMNQNDTQVQDLLRLMESAVNPNLGSHIDMRV